MSWWGVLLLLVGVQAAMVLAYWLLTRSKKAWPAELSKLLVESATVRLAEELAAEKTARGEVEDAMRSLAEKHKGIAAWYNAHKEAIDDEARKTYEELATDPSALDRKLDELLGPRPNDTTKPDPTIKDETGEG